MNEQSEIHNLVAQLAVKIYTQQDGPTVKRAVQLAWEIWTEVEKQR